MNRSSRIRPRHKNQQKQKQQPVILSSSKSLHLSSSCLLFVVAYCYLSLFGIATVLGRMNDEFWKAPSQQLQRYDSERQDNRTLTKLDFKYADEPNFIDQEWIFRTINLYGAWKMGFTGAGVQIRINDNNWEWNHTEWYQTRWDNFTFWDKSEDARLIEKNKNAETNYSCGDKFNKLTYPPRRIWQEGDSEKGLFNRGAAVTSVLGASGQNKYCGTGVAPLTKLSFCNFNHTTTNASVLMYNALNEQLGASRNSYDISINAYHYQGCSSEDRGEIVGLYRNKTRAGGGAYEISSFRQQAQQEKNIEVCPFRYYRFDNHNPGDDPCQECKQYDLSVIQMNNKRDNVFELASFSATDLKSKGKKSSSSSSSSKTFAGWKHVSKKCADSVRAYCFRNFRRDEEVCTEWLDVINEGNTCRFKSNVGVENNYALEKMAKEGRYGWGIVAIFAAGDSYGMGDNVNYQAYPKSRYVITVGAIKVKEYSENGELKVTHSSYSTGGSSIFVVAPGGDYDSPYRHRGAGGLERHWPEVPGSCIDLGYGSTFAAPIVGGVVALMISAWPFVTYRDVQHILVRTSRPVEDGDDHSYGINGAGVGYSDLYGFGLIDATQAVNETLAWMKSGFHVLQEIDYTAKSGDVHLTIDDDSFHTTKDTITIWNKYLWDKYFWNHSHVESINVRLKLRYFNRGHLKISIKSPSGAVSILSPGGRHEYGQLECDEWWEFRTLRFWGEEPYGNWTLSITDTKQGSGDVECIDRPTFKVYWDELDEWTDYINYTQVPFVNYTMYCADYEAEGFCVDGHINNDEPRLNHIINGEELNATLFDGIYEKCELGALDACCVCGGGIRPDDDEVLYNQLEKWEIVFGDGTPKIGTRRVSNYNPFLPKITDYEYIKCATKNEFGVKQDCCNGLAANCYLRVNEFLFPTLHNGLNEFDNGNFVTINKEFEIERAMEAGYRAFKLDVCNCHGNIEFCFGGLCDELNVRAGSRNVIDVMFYTLEFLERNPSEIVLFFFEMRSDVDEYVDLQEFWLLMLQVKGLAQKIYGHDAPNSTNPWPLLGEMIDNEKRVVMFHRNGPDCHKNPRECPKLMHYYYDWIADNELVEFREPIEIEKREESCSFEIHNHTELPNTFVGLRNFVKTENLEEQGKVHNYEDARRLNRYHAVQDYVESCEELLMCNISFIWNDWWSMGDVPRMTQDYNSARVLGELWDPPTPSPTEVPLTDSPTLYPTWTPTFRLATPAPTVSGQPSDLPSIFPSLPYDPCLEHHGDCRGCKKNKEHCLWCVSSSTCYNREVFEGIFDMDDEIIPCAGEDILNSFDTTCKAPEKSFVSVYDDDYVLVNETESDDDDVEEDADTASPTEGDPTPPPTLPPIFVPLSPPTAVTETKNFFTGLFGRGGGGEAESGGVSTLAPSGVFSCVLTAVLSTLILLCDV